MTNLIEAQSGVNLIIDPSAELRFRGPFNQPITNNLKLTNPLDEMIWFKIKTSEAKRYCVRPNSGKVHPRETVVVKISLQPSPYIDAYKNWKHKFMIQCVVLSEVEKNFVDVMDIWKELPADRFMNTKLNCVFELPAEAEKKISNVELFDHSEILANEIRELREENLNHFFDNRELQIYLDFIRESCLVINSYSF
uniref:MSP domain-containing protein n=1 Tax=Glossina brevipalpis TaxID=37001 RepID=A0A1A9W137_9MUSC